MDAFGKAGILDHVLDVQVFDMDFIETFQKIVGYLVAEVVALIRNLLMNLGDDLLCGFALIASAPLRLKLALSVPKLLLRSAEESRVVNLFASRERCEVSQANVNADVLTSLWDEARPIRFDCEDHKPAGSFPLDGAGFDRAFNWTGKTDTTRADFAQVQLIAFKPEAALWITERIKAVTPLESWIAWCLARPATAKEVIERLITPTQHVLKHLTVDGGNVWADGFDVGKLRSLIVVIDRDMADCVGVTPFPKAGVIQLTANIDSLFAVDFKCVVHFELVLVRLHGTDYTWFLWQNKPFHPFIIAFLA